jgi:hypothetical protein
MWPAEGANFMSIQEVSPERFAQLFHHYHQALADESGNAAYVRTRDAWADVPAAEKSRMVAAARLALLEVELTPGERQSKNTLPSRAKRNGVADQPAPPQIRIFFMTS